MAGWGWPSWSRVVRCWSTGSPPVSAGASADRDAVDRGQRLRRTGRPVGAGPPRTRRPAGCGGPASPPAPGRRSIHGAAEVRPRPRRGRRPRPRPPGRARPRPAAMRTSAASTAMPERPRGPAGAARWRISGPGCGAVEASRSKAKVSRDAPPDSRSSPVTSAAVPKRAERTARERVGQLVGAGGHRLALVADRPGRCRTRRGCRRPSIPGRPPGRPARRCGGARRPPTRGGGGSVASAGARPPVPRPRAPRASAAAGAATTARRCPGPAGGGPSRARSPRCHRDRARSRGCGSARAR